MKVIIEYPDNFPISEPLRTVFTKRIGLFFDASYNTWSMSHNEMLEKLFAIRCDVQKSIGYPPAIPHSPEAYLEEPRPSPWPAPKERPRFVASSSSESIEDILSHEELLCWKNILFIFLGDLPPDARDAGLEMASRILGIHIYYEIDNTAINNGDLEWSAADDNGATQQVTANNIAEAFSSLPPAWSDDPMPPEISPAQLCPFSQPKRIGTLTKGWSHEDRKILTHTIKHHVEVVALGAFVIGLVFGFLIDATNGHAARYGEGSGQLVPQVAYTHPARLMPSIPVHQDDNVQTLGRIQPHAGVQPPAGGQPPVISSRS